VAGLHGLEPPKSAWADLERATGGPRREEKPIKWDRIIAELIIHYKIDIRPDFDLRFINTLHGVADGNLPGQNVDNTTQFLWVWRHRFKKFLHPDVVEIALREELARWKRGEPGIYFPDKEQMKAEASENVGYIYLS